MTAPVGTFSASSPADRAAEKAAAELAEEYAKLDRVIEMAILLRNEWMEGGMARRCNAVMLIKAMLAAGILPKRWIPEGWL